MKEKITLIEKRPRTQPEPESLTLQYELSLLELKKQLESVEDQLKHFTDHVRPLEIAKHTGEAKIAASQLRRQKVIVGFQTEQLKAALEAAKLPVDVEQQHLQEIEKTIEKCRVLAPRDGMIPYVKSPLRGLSVIEIEEGAPLRERQSVMTLYDPENRQATTYVHESRLAQLKEGQKAAIRVDAVPNEVYSGTVTKIADSPARFREPGNEKRYAVVVEIEKPQPELKPGMSCRIEIDITEFE